MTKKTTHMDAEEKIDAGKTGIELALEAVNGNGSVLARMLGISPQSIALWKKSGVVPPKRAKQISDLLKIPREKLNPEIFG